MKTCAKCNIEKAEEDFHKSTATKDGLQNMCKECKKEANKAAKNLVDPIEEQLLVNIKEAQEALRKYRINRATQQEIERQIAQAAIEEYRKKAHAEGAL